MCLAMTSFANLQVGAVVLPELLLIFSQATEISGGGGYSFGGYGIYGITPLRNSLPKFCPLEFSNLELATLTVQS